MGPFTTDAMGLTPAAQKEKTYRKGQGETPGREGRRWNGHGRRSFQSYPDVVTVIIPPGFTSIVSDGQNYYYRNGVFYRLDSSQALVPAPAPVGAVVPDIPITYKNVTVHDVLYSTAEGVYYQKTSNGYRVVRPPQAAGQEATGNMVLP